MENRENLVGPRSDERESFEPDNMRAKDGQPLWMALLDDIDAINVKPEEVHEAKNRLSKLMGEHEEEVKACMKMPLNECKQSLMKFEEETA